MRQKNLSHALPSRLLFRAGCLLLLFLLVRVPTARCEDGAHAFPPALCFTQHTTVTRQGPRCNVSITLPETCREDVDREIGDIVSRMAEEGRPYLVRGKSNRLPNWLDVGAYINRIGSRWLSFMIVGRVTDRTNQIWVSMDTRVYNMETGQRVLLEDILRDDAWDRLSAEVRNQLSSLFPAEKPGQKALNALCSPEGLRAAGLTLSPGHLSLVWRADQLYSAHSSCLMRAEIYVPELWDLLTEEARKEMDCSGYTMIALTYDDGPSWNGSDQLINELRLYGGEHTFFVIGKQLHKFPQSLNREYDAGYSVQSHTWNHSMARINQAEMEQEAREMAEALAAVIGREPVMMRSPGGQESVYSLLHGVLPRIHWSITTDDASANRALWGNSSHINAQVNRAGDGDIVLLHDGSSVGFKHARKYLPILTERSVLFVTVRDLCALRGIPLDRDTLILRCPPK